MDIKKMVICGHCMKIMHRNNIWEHISSKHDCDKDFKTYSKMTMPICMGIYNKNAKILKDTKNPLLEVMKVILDGNK